MHAVNEKTRLRYEVLPYGSYAYPHSAPEQLEVVASLFGVPAPAVGTARVLELGAAAGGNIIPFALRHPQAQVMGVDISGAQVAMADSLIAKLGIGNVTMFEADFLEMDPSVLGTFDYIVCHGVYSWIPEPAQKAMMDILQKCLAPDGVAYVSYNTYPGWKTKEVVRDAMLFHGGLRDDPVEQVAYGRAMVEFLARVTRKGGVTDLALKENLSQIRNSPADYIAHDYLEPCNLPCYFHEFLKVAKARGLSYLGEAQPSMMMPFNYGPELARTLYSALGDDQVKMEQYLDFSIDRAFRQTLLVHGERARSIEWKIDRTSLRCLHFAAHLTCIDGTVRLNGASQEFKTPAGQVIATRLSGIKQAVVAMAKRWPGTASREELIAFATRAQTDAPDAVGSDMLEQGIDELLEALVLRGMARIRLAPVERAASVPLQPIADPVLRRMVSTLNEDQGSVANVWHDSIDLSLLERYLIQEMDGSRDIAGLIECVGMRHERISASGALDQKTVAEMLDRLLNLGVLMR